jgi:hypothetical protein
LAGRDEPNPAQPQATEPAEPVGFKTTENMLAEVEAEKRAKKFEDQRLRRELKRQQKKRIKEMLKIPIAQVKAEAEAKRKAEKLPGMNRGRTMKGAPPGNQIITGGYDSTKLDLIDTYRESNEEGLRRNKTEGEGPANFNKDEMEYNPRVPRGSFGQPEPGEAKHFDAWTIKDPGEIDGIIEEVAQEYFIPSDFIQCRCEAILKKDELESHLKSAEVHAEDTDKDIEEQKQTYWKAEICHLCQDIVVDTTTHMVTHHGSESEPKHDARFGDVLGPAVRRLIRTKKKRMRDWERQGRENAAEIRASSKTRTRTTVEDAEREGMVQQGPWIQIKGGRWVRDWVPKQASD